MMEAARRWRSTPHDRTPSSALPSAVIAPEHPLIDTVLTDPPDGIDPEQIRARHRGAEQIDLDRRADSGEKTGVFNGLLNVNPLNNERVPIWISDYVLMEYGHGAIMAVPGHDDRDHAFAQHFGLPIIDVVRNPNENEEQCYAGEGIMMNSSSDLLTIDGQHTAEAKATVIDWLEANGRGRGKSTFDCVTGCSHDNATGENRSRSYSMTKVITMASATKPSSLELPSLADFAPVESDDPTPLLGKAGEWLHTTAGEAEVYPRIQLDPSTPVVGEANTMPGWAGSCWYYLRYCDPANHERFASREAERYWMEPRSDQSPRASICTSVAGEHAVLHLLYARFWHKLLYDYGEVSSPEPFAKLFHQGILTSFAYQRPDTSLVPVDEVRALEPTADTSRSRPVNRLSR